MNAKLRMYKYCYSNEGAIYAKGLQAAFWNSEGKGGLELETHRHGHTCITHSIPRAWGFSRGSRQECESANKLTTLLTTAESKIQDKHLSMTHVYVHLQKKSDKIWEVHFSGSKDLKVDQFLVRKLFATNTHPLCLFTLCQEYIFIKKLL